MSPFARASISTNSAYASSTGLATNCQEQGCITVHTGLCVDELPVSLH